MANFHLSPDMGTGSWHALRGCPRGVLETVLGAPASGIISEAVLGVGIKIKWVSFPGIQDEYSNDRDSIPSFPTKGTPITSVQFSSVAHSCPTLRPHESARQASLFIISFRSSLRLTSIESVMPSSHLIFCRPLLLLHPIPSSIRVFSNESTLCMRWSKY